MVHSPQRRKFEKWLESYIGKCEAGHAIAPQRKLSETWNLSRLTVSRVIRQFIMQGLLQGAAGRGTIVTGPGIHTVPGAAQTVADAVLAAIRSGTLKEGEILPSVKYMCLQYKVAPSTVIAAYRLLIEKDAIFKMGKRFLVGKPYSIRESAARRAVAVFAWERSTGSVFDDLLMGLAYRKMERELIRHNFKILYRPSAGFAQTIKNSRQTINRFQAIIGLNIPSEAWSELRKPLSNFTSNKNAPLLTLIGHFSLPLQRKITCFSKGNLQTVIFRALAQFILRKGYRQVRFIFNANKPSLHSISACIKLYAEIENLSSSINVQYFCVVSSKQKAAFVKHLCSFIKSGRSAFSKYRHLAKDLSLGNMEIIQCCKNAFCRPAPDSIWVFSNDSDAYECLLWAHENRIKVPHDLGIIGLQNDPAFLESGLSTCIHDWETSGYLFAHSIIGDFALQKTTSGFAPCQPLLLNRTTTR